MRNTKGVLPVTGIVPTITKTMHRSFTDSIVSVTRNLFSDEVEVILSVSRFCNKRAGFPIKIFGETLRFSVNLVTRFAVNPGRVVASGLQNRLS